VGDPPVLRFLAHDGTVSPSYRQRKKSKRLGRASCCTATFFVPAADPGGSAGGAWRWLLETQQPDVEGQITSELAKSADGRDFGLAERTKVGCARGCLATSGGDGSQLARTVGGSMGAQQTCEWAVRFPDMVKRAAPIAGTAKNTPHDFLFTDTLSEAIRSDPAWRGGWYSSAEDVHLGLRRHARLWAAMGVSTEFYKQEVWRELGFSSLEDALVGFVEGYVLPMDPNDLLCQAWKWQRGDVSRHTDGDLAAALGRVRAKTFAMPIDEDMFFPVRDCQAEQRLIPRQRAPRHQQHLGAFRAVWP
jgi:pimeloyl-ACP methyl ester carboxylesterase